MKLQWLSGPCILKHGTRTILSPAVLWGKPILPGRAPAHLFAWGTSAHRCTPESEQISSPITHHPQPPAKSSRCKHTTWLPEGQQGEHCPRASPPYLAPVLDQSGFQLQGQLQEPVLHLDKTVVTDRLGLCSQDCCQARATLRTPGNAGGDQAGMDTAYRKALFWST